MGGREGAQGGGGVRAPGPRVALLLLAGGPVPTKGPAWARGPLPPQASWRPVPSRCGWPWSEMGLIVVAGAQGRPAGHGPTPPPPRPSTHRADSIWGGGGSLEDPEPQTGSQAVGGAAPRPRGRDLGGAALPAQPGPGRRARGRRSAATWWRRARVQLCLTGGGRQSPRLRPQTVWGGRCRADGLDPEAVVFNGDVNEDGVSSCPVRGQGQGLGLEEPGQCGWTGQVGGGRWRGKWGEEGQTPPGGEPDA